MFRLVTFLLFLGFYSIAHAQPANDECTGAVSLPVNADNYCTGAYTANITGATQSVAPCVSFGYPVYDVWYKFVATSATQSITLTPTSYTDFVMQVYEGTCNSLSPLACIDNTGIMEIEGGTLNNLTPGNTYYFRVYSKYGWPNIQYQLCVNSNAKAIPNDEASGAIQRSTAGGDFTHFSNLGATLSLPACTGSANNDIWFKFVATGNRHIIRYYSAGNVTFPTAVEVFSGTPGNLTSIKCYGLSDNSVLMNDLIPGATYYYRIYINTGSAVKTDFITYVITPPPVPQNDECTGAISLAVNNDNSFANVYTANVTGATQSLAPCVSTAYSANDVWYKFVATSSTHSLMLTPTSYTDFVLQVYGGSCNSLSSIACINNTGISEIEGATLTNLTPGATYFVRVYSKYGWPDMQFQLGVNSSAKPIPNDEASGAIQKATTGGNFTHHSNLGATLSQAACSGNADNDIWFKFVATGSRHIIHYHSAGYVDYPTAVEVFSGSPGNLTSVQCYALDDNTADISRLAPGVTYFYRIYIPTGNSVKTDFYTYVSTPVTPPPANDECTGAVLLPVNADNSCASTYTADVTGATQSLAPCIANGYTADDVWYKFVATAATHSITLYPASFTDFAFQVYSGSCNSLSSIACVDNTGISEVEAGTLKSLTPGNTYYLRVYSKYAWPDVQFQLCINSNAKPIANDEPEGAILKSTVASDYTHYSNLGATLSLPACTGSADNDIWFKFVATSTKHTVHYHSAGYVDYPTAVEVFSGAPDHLTSIKCYGLLDNIADLNGLTPGNTYYYRIYIPTGDAAKTDFYTYVSTSASTPVPIPPPLPARFLSFKGVNNNNMNHLYWETAEETNLSGFDIEVSTDGIEFQKLDFIKYVDSGRTSNTYTYQHLIGPLIIYDKLYYRIKAIDKSNQYIYSPDIFIEQSQTGQVNVFPNPVRDKVMIKGAGYKTLEFSIADISGRVCLKGMTSTNVIDVSRLKQGSYLLTISSNDHQFKKTFTLLKIEYL